VSHICLFLSFVDTILVASGQKFVLFVVSFTPGGAADNDFKDSGFKLAGYSRP
jgi:hypothetical protein